jgi:hypothetical protein
MLATQAETAISQLVISEQEYLTYQVATNMKHLYKQYNRNQNYNTTLDKKKEGMLNQIKEKLNNNDALISKSDKGNSIVIIYRNTNREKVMNFIHNNKFTNITSYKKVTKSSQKEYQ